MSAQLKIISNDEKFTYPKVKEVLNSKSSRLSTIKYN